MSLSPLSVLFPATGSFMSEDPVIFTPEAVAAGVPFVHLATNLRVEESQFRTRKSWVEMKPGIVAADWAALATQGAVWYNPRFGAGPTASSKATPGIVESAEGKLFRITLSRRGYDVVDISSGIRARPSMRLAWMAVGENYVVRTDGASLTQIYDGTQTTTSTGYNPNSPDTSRLPNYAGPVAYTDRFWITANQRDIIAGDFLHRIVQTDASDILKTTEQALDITSKSFPPPANLGDVTGMFIVTGNRGGALPSQAEVMASTDAPAIWGVLGGTPRIEWATTPMVRIIHAETGPTGPYAASTGKNELLMRTPGGIHSLKYIEQDSSRPGNPLVNLGEEIKPLLDADPKDLLIYASLVNTPERQHCAVTVGPRVKNRQRWHTGYVTATYQPTRVRVPNAMVWEGVHTLPKRMGQVVQFIEANQFGSKRIFAILRKEDGTKAIAEWTEDDGPDRLADGTAVPITWQILTRKLTRGEYNNHGWGAMFLRLQNVRESVSVKISARDHEAGKFKEIWQSDLCNPGWCEEGKLANSRPLSLGSILSNFKGEWIQLLIEGVGSCTVDIAIGDSTAGLKSDQGSRVPCLDASECNYNIFARSP